MLTHNQKLDVDLDNDTDEALREFLVSLWFDPGNTTAYAYLGLLAPDLGLFNHPVMEIRRNVASDKFEFSKHAVDQSIMHQIQVNEIEEAIANGQLIEDYSNNKYNSSYLICGFTQSQRPIHIKCSYPNRPLIKIIAIYEPDPERWSENFSIRKSVAIMSNDQEFLVEDRVTYTLQLNGKFYLFENVPARVNDDTGEYFFSPSTLLHLQHLILNGKEPDRVIETPVYSYSE